MYAVVQTGGKQYRVSEGDVISVEKLNAEAGSTVVLNEVLVIGGEAETVVGKPFIEGAAVSAEVLENGKGKKVIIFKYKAKKDYRRKQGHRQPYTKLQIKSISANGEFKAEPAKAEAVKAEEPAKVNLKSMKKAELVQFAADNNIELDPKATNAEMIAAIEAALK
ncbi:MAG: 50S ribosomal protein L21 [Firmicutes bacterium]|nr:50S ribosomal protein L21 [Bacillota bacterium]